MNEPETWRIHWRYHCFVTCVTQQWTSSHENSHLLLRSQRHGATIVPTRMSKWKFQWYKPRTVAFTKCRLRDEPKDAADLEWPLSEGMQVSALPPVWIAMIIFCWSVKMLKLPSETLTHVCGTNSHNCWAKGLPGVGVVKIIYDSDSSGWKSFILRLHDSDSTALISMTIAVTIAEIIAMMLKTAC